MTTQAETFDATQHADSADAPAFDPSRVESDYALDVSGLPCPMPGLRIIKALRELEPGQVLSVTCGSRIVRKMAPQVVRVAGNRFLGSFEGADGAYRLLFEKAQPT